MNGTDLAGNIGYAIPFDVTGDLTPPTITIENIVDFDLFGSNLPFYNITITGDNFQSAWYTLNGGSNNYTISSAVVGSNSGTLSSASWSGLVSGNYLLNFYVNETSGNIANQSVWIEKDITPPIISIINPLDLATITDTVPNFNYTVLDIHLDSVWYSLNNGPNRTVTGNGTIDSVLWGNLADGIVYIRFYANDTVGNVGMDLITVSKKTTTNAETPPPGGLDPILMIIIIGVIAAVAVFSIIMISKRSKKEIKAKEAEIKSLKKQREEITDGDILISKEQHICLVHKGSIKGMSYICPECGAYYCVNCYNALIEVENECWSCNSPLDQTRPSVKSKEVGVSKDKKETKDIEIREIESAELSESPKGPKGPKSDLKSTPIKPAPQLTIKAPSIVNPEVPLGSQESISEMSEAIEILDNYIAEINVMLQEIETNFNTGAISQEEYIEKKTLLEQKRVEAIAKRDQLKE